MVIGTRKGEIIGRQGKTREIYTKEMGINEVRRMGIQLEVCRYEDNVMEDIVCRTWFGHTIIIIGLSCMQLYYYFVHTSSRTLLRAHFLAIRLPRASREA